MGKYYYVFKTGKKTYKTKKLTPKQAEKEGNKKSVKQWGLRSKFVKPRK